MKILEVMESRLMLSGSAGYATPTYVAYSSNRSLSVASRVDQPASGSSSAGGLTAAQIRSAYGLGTYGSSNITFNGVQGDGTGQTIALIDAYNDPNAISDLSAFDAHFNLPDPPSFQVLNQNGGTSLPSSNSGWSIEESLDVQWAHVMAPGANIILYEASSNSSANLYAAAITAAKATGVSVASMSFGSNEFSGETSYDGDFIAPTSHQGVTFFASTGDTGAAVEYPAQSPNVVAVGGTSLYLSGSTYSSESAWGSGGGGTSSYESQPSYQTGTITATRRETPDVSLDADPSTGVPIYDTYAEGSSTPWAVYGGTSLSSPMFAGLVAVADQGRVAEGLGTLTGKQTLTRLYQLSATNFHDVTSGSNGHSAIPGYDEATGIGSSITNLLAPDLAGSATITGRIFADPTGTGVYQSSDNVMASQTVYLDLNNDGKLDNSEPTATTNAQGVYTFTDQPAGGTVRMSTPAISGYVAIPASASVAYGATNTINFTYFPLSFSNTTAATNFTIQTDATNANDQILINGTVTYSVAKSVLSGQGLSFSLTGTGDSFTVNAANGNPLPSGGIALTGPTAGLPLSIVGTATGNDTFNVSSASVTFDSDIITASKISLLTLNPGTGTDSLTANSGSATIAAQTNGGGMLTRNFSNISIAAGSSVLFATAASHNDHTLAQTSTLSVLGQLDLGGNDLIVHNGILANIAALLTTGYANGTWNGPGIASAAAYSDTSHLTALGSIQNTLYGGTGQPLFDNTVAPLPTDVLIKYTYYGDATLDGKIDGTDYSRIDGSYHTSATPPAGWFNGDFNYDNRIDGSDYTLIDNDFNTQGASLAARIAAPASIIATPAGATATAPSAAIATPMTPNNSDQPGVEKRLTSKDLLDRLNQ